MTKFLDLSKMGKITCKLYEGFVEANFKFMHFRNVREMYRGAFLEIMSNAGINENLKIIDIEKKLITHLSWYNYSEDSCSYREGTKGRYHQITSLPYECVNTVVKVKCNQKKLRTPLKILEE